uniref:Non-structural polyprotein 1AB n=1 Tax=Miniopterus bat astrovirus TaxID=3141885 RepID=A0AAU7E2R7_9VIRU
MKLDAWKDFLHQGERTVLPPELPLIGRVDIDRPISDWYEPNDPLLGLLPRPPVQELCYGPSVWGYDAYGKSFEKFFYAKPVDNISKVYPREWRFASYQLIREYGYLKGTHVLDIVSTVKNVESTPGFPKFLYWQTEAEFLDERGYADYVRQYEDIKNGERPQVLWYLFLKKEILKETKIRDGDIRQIVCPDPIYSRIGAMFEQDQNNRMKSNTRWRQGQCGWSPFEGGFDEIFSRLDRPGNKFIEFDWTRFDGTIPVEVFKHIKNFRFSLLDKVYQTEVNRSIYEWYVDQLLNRHVLLPSGEITLQDRGNPSGQISTTMDNNMVNTFLQAFEFAYLFPELDHNELCTLYTEVDSIVYGDDRVSSWPIVPDDYITRVVAMYEHIFGMWVKPDKVRVTSTLVGVTFCGFTAIFKDGLYLPVPSDAWKFICSTIKPVKSLPDFDALVGKILSYQILTYNLPDDDPVKVWFESAYAALSRHVRVDGGEPLPLFTRDMLDYLWRGGPKDNYGGRPQA